ncbi:MAG: hypothetical protein JST10_02495 [Bacteroidetes bacterium]|nr:hypothetical protein [Bacteroidota bacterium]MBS1631420.1 hypothetical protein [Bacteroidota bacterium]
MRIKRKYSYRSEDIYKTIKNVPYYVENNYGKGSIESYPLLMKSDIIGNEEKFLSTKCNKLFLSRVATSGSSGKSLNLYKGINDVIKEEVFTDQAFSLIGKNLRIAVLRGNRPSKGIYEYKFGHLLLSSYNLSKENVHEYLKLIKRYRINCFHVYPSSISIFCKYLREIIEEKKTEIPAIKGIFSSSEILSMETKNLILDLFPDITLVDRYGMSEHVASAISVNKGNYHFQDGYSIVELLDTGLKNEGRRIMEIVGTNINNKAMPLVRYCTEDFVEVDEMNNIVSIIGRTSDFVVNIEGNIVPCTVVNRDDVLLNVIAHQHYQDKVGELVLRIQGNEKFSGTDIKYITDDWTRSFQNLMRIKVEVVTDFDRTSNGKLINLVQKLNLDNIRTQLRSYENN